ncbi:MAG: cryptochrome/photolyase family protein [Candidatus Hodarchaeales archaeon]|jgi:deoxyribodipyrimidine photo-lyase
MSQKDETGNNSLVIFRRDLRLADNTAFYAAVESSKHVIPVFIYDLYLLNNPNRSLNAIQFMQESLLDLKRQLKKAGGELYQFKGKPWIIVENLLSDRDLDIKSIFINRDYTPYSKKRDELIRKKAKDRNVRYRIFSDLLLNEPELVLKKDGSAYTVFTPFYRRASEIKISLPEEVNADNIYSDSIESLFRSEDLDFSTNPLTFMKGGRDEGILILENISEFTNYENDRNYPAKKGTTLLSPHLRFGTLSIREVYKAIYSQGNIPLIRQLYWRDFYHYIGFHFPHVFTGPFRSKYKTLKWASGKNLFKEWTEGMTGFPIVDAGMRQLNKTGYMHNRVRMIVASFLTKDLQINWQWGEIFFARKLLDYDISVNNGNWQWSSSTGCDPVPYFRIFNPWTQQKKFDSECHYIKEYIPELRGLTPKEIHGLEKQRPSGLKYPKPIVDHSKARKAAILMFKNIQEI